MSLRAQATILRVRRGVALAGIHCVFAEYGTVVIAMPQVGYTYGALRNVHAFVPVFFGRDVRYPQWYARTLTNDFFDDCEHVWKTRGVGKGRETVAADHGI
jgi:hypothetical protein